MLQRLLDRRRTYVDYLDRVLIRLPDTAATRRHGFAGAVREVVIGRLHVRIPHRGQIIRIPHREAGIDRDPLTSWLFIRPECLPSPPNERRRAATSIGMSAGSVTSALAACPKHASVVVSVDDCRHQAHAVAEVGRTAPAHISIGRAVAFSAAKASITPTMATMRVSDLRDFLALADPADPIVLTCGTEAAYTVRSLSVTSSRVVWLVTGRRINSPKPLLARVMAWLQH